MTNAFGKAERQLFQTRTRPDVRRRGRRSIREKQTDTVLWRKRHRGPKVTRWWRRAGPFYVFLTYFSFP
jgi:hypothetical protein